jgi:hypothetical protein
MPGDDRQRQKNAQEIEPRSETAVLVQLLAQADHVALSSAAQIKAARGDDNRQRGIRKRPFR